MDSYLLKKNRGIMLLSGVMYPYVPKNLLIQLTKSSSTKILSIN